MKLVGYLFILGKAHWLGILGLFLGLRWARPAKVTLEVEIMEPECDACLKS